MTDHDDGRVRELGICLQLEPAEREDARARDDERRDHDDERPPHRETDEVRDHAALDLGAVFTVESDDDGSVNVARMIGVASGSYRRSAEELLKKS